MNKRRSEGQKLMPIPVTEQLLKEIDSGVAVSGIGDRSKFVRFAIREKLESLGIKCPPEIWLPPTRVGKAGKRKAEVDSATGSASVLNDQKSPYGEAAPPPQNCLVSEAAKPPQPAAPKPSKIQRPKTP